MYQLDICETNTPNIVCERLVYFYFPNFLIIGLCNSLPNSSFCINSFLTTPPEVFFFIEKKSWTIKASECWYLSCYGFLAMLNASSHNTLSAAALLFKSLKSP